MSNAQVEANKRWYASNKEHAKYLNKRSHTRSFIRNYATVDDLKEIELLIKERYRNLSNEEIDANKSR